MMLVGILIWAIGRLFDSTATLRLAVVIATYSQFPKIVQSLSNIVQGLLLDLRALAAVSIGPARFVDPADASPVILGLLGRLDLFVLWGVLLMAIGLEVLGRVPKAQAYAAAGLVWLMAGIPPVVGVFAA